MTLITAGAPRVLSTAFAAEVKAWHKDSDRPFQNFRFVHGRDPVPSLGPQDWGCVLHLLAACAQLSMPMQAPSG